MPSHSMQHPRVFKPLLLDMLGTWIRADLDAHPPNRLAASWVKQGTDSPGQGQFPPFMSPSLPAHTPGRHQCNMGLSSVMQLSPHVKDISSHGCREDPGRAWDPHPAKEGVVRRSMM